MEEWKNFTSIEKILTSLMKKLCEEIPCGIWLFTITKTLQARDSRVLLSFWYYILLYKFQF